MKRAKTKKIKKKACPENKLKLFFDLMDTIPDVIYFKDTKGKLIMVNKTHAKGLNLSPDEVVGKTDFDFFPKKKAQKMHNDDMQVIKTGQPIIDKIERSTRVDGVDNFVSTTKIPRYDDKGSVVGLIGITRDISQRIYTQKLTEDKEKILKRLRASEELNALKSEFISVVSHELRTPLSIIKEAISLLADQIMGPLNKKQKVVSEKAKQNAIRLDKLIDDLLDISRIQTKKLKLHYYLVNLNDLITDNSDFFTKTAEQKGISLEYDLPEEQINIFIDPERITQVITNLITNALKFTEQNGRIKVEVRILKDNIRVGVIDAGVGIAEDHLEILFDRFVQVAKKPGVQSKGLGLGLSISKEIVKMHNGEIWAESELGVGSSFYFILPMFYTDKPLDEQVRSQANSLIAEGRSVCFVNLLIHNYNKFKKLIPIASKKLFSDFENIAQKIVSGLLTKSTKDSKLVFIDRKKSSFGLLIPDTDSKQAKNICAKIRDELSNYFEKNKVRNCFINVGVISLPFAESQSGYVNIAGDINIEKIYVGANIRSSERIPCSSKIDYSYEKKLVSKTINISKGGLCFLSKNHLRTDSIIDIRLKIPGSREYFLAKARIAWVSKADGLDEGFYKIGLEFIKLSASNKKILSKFIESRAKRDKRRKNA